MTTAFCTQCKEIFDATDLDIYGMCLDCDDDFSSQDLEDQFEELMKP